MNSSSVMAEEERRQVVLTKPFSLEDDHDDSGNYAAPNLIRRILSLFKNVRPGSDLTTFQLPPHFNLPKSHLQCYGEVLYSFGGDDLLGHCNRGERPIQRLKSVLTWNLSTFRPLIFGVSPYNPILGETHHVSRGNIHVLLEQVSHHPPVSALHATHEEENIEIIWCHHVVPKFRGTFMEAEVKGKRLLKLLNHGETYEMNSPDILMRFLPAPAVNWAGKVKIMCPQNGLGAELQLMSANSLMGIRGSNRSLKGKIYQISPRKDLFEISGHWDKTVTAKELKTGKLEVIYNAKESLTGLGAPTVKSLKEVRESESTVVWSEVSRAIMSKDWERAREAKRAVEERQRKSLEAREASGQTWVPQHFSVTFDGRDWECSPLQTRVPQAPIVMPL